MIKFTLEYCNNLPSGTKVTFIIGQSRAIGSDFFLYKTILNVVCGQIEVAFLTCPNNFCSMGSLPMVTVMALSGAVCKYMYATLVGGLCGSSSENPATVGMRDCLSRVQGHLAFC